MMKKISLFTLVLMIVAAIDSIRNLPAMALFGSTLPFFFLFSAVVFLFPISLIAAEFASRFPEEGGVFPWIRHAFGRRTAFIAVWLQWINTMVWYPTILSFIAGTAAYLIAPELAANRVFLVSVILIVFWGLTFANLFGIHVSARINTLCSIIGTLIPMLFLILLGIFWVVRGHPISISFRWDDLLPTLSSSDSWTSLVAIIAAFLGLELSGVHVKDIRDPQKNFPKALGFSVFILVTTMLLGALSIAALIPSQEIRLVDGIMQSFRRFFEGFGLAGLTPALALLIIVGSVGGMINWLLAPAKGLMQASKDGFLPFFLSKENKYGVAQPILLLQAFLVTIFSLTVVLSPNINAFYWFFTALSTGLYVFMYILLILAALKLGRPARGLGAYRIPKGFRKFACVLGLFGCVATIVVSFFPPEGIKVNSAWQYGMWIAIGNLVLIAPSLLLGRKKKRPLA